MFQIRNKSDSKYIDAKFKNKHMRSRNKLSRKSSNSLKQEFRNEKCNLHLFDRLYSNRANQQYSLSNYLKSEGIDSDYQMILKGVYDEDSDACGYGDIDIWTCPRCTYCNMERSSYCKICELPCPQNSASDPRPSSSITLHATLSQFIIPDERKLKNKIKRKKFPKKSVKPDVFRFDDDTFIKFKAYMKRHKTSIIAHKKEKNDGNDGWKLNKMERAKRQSRKLYAMYRTVYFAQNQNKAEITQIIQQMTSLIPKKYLKIALDRPSSSNTICKVCFADTQKEECLHMVRMNKYCSHSMICSECFAQYCNVQICEDEHILPWISCPAQDCKAPIPAHLLLQYVSVDKLYKFARSFLYKHLQRCSYFVECPDLNDKKCSFGWLIFNDQLDGDMELECEACGRLHRLREREAESDGFADMISQGILRECPKCSYPAMKDYGMCNVMHCIKCNVYWNWRTKEMGSSSNEVKQRARSNGTLWAQGELAFQQDLQRNNLPEFIALLARNGIKYDPNYRRGS